MKRHKCAAPLSLLILPAGLLWAQGVAPYPDADTGRTIVLKTPMSPPPVNLVFQDPDFGSRMIRVTDQYTRPESIGSYFKTPDIGEQNTFSQDTQKFYVVGQGGRIVPFSFDPVTMQAARLQNASTGKALLVPFQPAPSFSFVDPDVIYGTMSSSPLTIRSYRFSTGAISTVVDTNTCGTQPPLSSTAKSGGDLTVSASDTRFAIGEGGPEVDKHMFVIVYDKNLGCRWYNTQTGQIGGQWGPSGTAPIPAFLIRHPFISRDGKYVRIVGGRQTLFWETATLNVTLCSTSSPIYCGGYKAEGYSQFVHASGLRDEMNIWMRRFDDFANRVELVVPPETPPQWGIEKHYSWLNVDSGDSLPVCASTYRYDSYGQIDRAWDGEIICIETDGLASTIWRFAHNRASAELEYFLTQPLGNVSQDGQFFMFTSDWDQQLGTLSNGSPRPDAWIVELR